MEHLYIRHVFGGKALLDSERHQASFRLEQAENCWRFAIEPGHADIKRLLQLRDELNIFVVSKEDPACKTWYYTSDGNVRFDDKEGKIIILADAKFDYTV